MGDSDFRVMVCFATKINVTIIKPKHVTCRSFKHFSEANFLSDLSAVPFHACEIVDSVQDFKMRITLIIHL